MGNRRLRVSMSLVVFGFAMSGCATIFGKANPQAINIKSTPDQARVVVTDIDEGAKVYEGSTPTIVSLKKGRGFFQGRHYEVVISKSGYRDVSVAISPQVGGWYIFGNLAVGGLIGWLIVDPATGAMWNLGPKEIDESLTAQQASMRLTPGEIQVVLLEQVPLELRSQMVSLSAK